MWNEESGLVKTLVILARISKFIRLKGLVRAVRSRASLTLVAGLHEQVIHCMRDLSIKMKQWQPGKSEPSALLAVEVCTKCRDLLGDLLELSEHDLHCCLKLFNKLDEKGNANVITWARSKPQDYHFDDGAENEGHAVDENSVWSALLGRDDKETNWKRPYSCFSCDDLLGQGSKFVCSRENWDNHYKATLVFPLRYLVDPEKGKYKTIGFIAFYSPKAKVFGNIPNIFEYTDDWHEYHNNLKCSTAFQLGACMADILSTFLRPVYETNKALVLHSTEEG